MIITIIMAYTTPLSHLNWVSLSEILNISNKSYEKYFEKRMESLIREPLTHFFIIDGIIFLQ